MIAATGPARHASPVWPSIKPSDAPRHPRGARARVLLSSVFKPFAQDDAFGSRVINPIELYHNQVTRAQGPFSLRMFHRSWGLMFIHRNISAPATLLDFPTRKAFVRELIDAGTLGSHSIRIEFYGANPAFVMAQAAAAGVPDVVEAAPRIPQALARARQLDADVLLLLDWIVPGIQGYASGKVFEYFGARKPILAIGPRGSVIEGLLRETRAGVLATSSSDVKAALEKWLAARSSTGILPYEGDSGAVNRYSRRVQTGALARVLDSVAREGDSSP